MDLPSDLPEGWEKKALIVVVVIVFIIAVYAFNPFQPKANVTSDNLSSPAAPTIVPLPQPDSGNSSNISSNSSNITNGTPSQITADQAKNIAVQSNPGYIAGQPTQGTVVVNSTTVAVWIVPITRSGSSKTIYIDLTSGRIVKET
jgi:hypothetical protein